MWKLNSLVDIYYELGVLYKDNFHSKISVYIHLRQK